ncbi:MAG: hypothetical protein P4L98_01305 [Ancalomicrobiaceae bacterium]|nr:hypothetical protein [Ancalomicrobiaceae bacterium]
MAEHTRPTGDGIRLTDLEVRRRSQRNFALALSLAGLVGLFYVMTLVKLGAGAGIPH